ncbi:MAG: NifU family protein [Bacilli bacterium]|jgi:Fe-S cluster biogenesis protein NfuA
MKIEKQIEEVLEKIRPFLQNDGGDVSFIKYEDGIVFVNLIGACSNCPLASITLETTIQNALTSQIPEIKRVININD